MRAWNAGGASKMQIDDWIGSSIILDSGDLIEAERCAES